MKNKLRIRMGKCIDFEWEYLYLEQEDFLIFKEELRNIVKHFIFLSPKIIWLLYSDDNLMSVKVMYIQI